MRNEPLQREFTFAFAADEAGQYTLRQAWESFHRSNQHSDRYIADIDCSLRQWERITGNPPVSAITNYVMHQFKERLFTNPIRGKQYEATTVNKHLRNIEAILSAIGPKDRHNPYAHGILSEVPRVPPAKEGEAEPVVASAEEISCIYKACQTATWPRSDRLGYATCDYWRALLVFLFNVGCRKSEFKLLTQQDCNLQEGIVLVRSCKTRKKRPLPINRTVISHLTKIWLPRRVYVWYTQSNDRMLYEQWEKIQLAADIYVPRPEGSDRRNVFGFHELRKTCATEMFLTNPGVAQQFCGHSSIDTTTRHYVNMRTVLRAAVEQREQPAAFNQEVG